MWSFEIENVHTHERTITYGYSYNDALRRAGIDGIDYEYIRQDYED